MATKEETEAEQELRIRSAERAHDRDLKGVEVHSKQIEAFAQIAMRAPALVAAGGVAASLGFYSANYERLAGHAEALKLFNDALTWMLMGILLTLLAPGLAYFSQLAYLDSVSSREHHWFSPYSRATRRAKIGEIIGNICRWSCVAVVTASIACVATGGIKFLHLVATL
ncbi:hypothetical protein HGO34_12670 [Agrobacterium vitis]|uniref:Uncharacterized protein n=1 Tax=Agrobacterium vitis TaxID=373 RepID=A0AAE4WGJ9_AGRVI|nr:hypothetical protein [Agrobacterium vitis]MCF1501209.1 hypothetical protein [Allorhizobium sp. Av2]MCM2440569.1 hypothetical protein [Agrobacterium vitis]MUZ59555.1 hypothetical protein [Agrobacterium vitis]MVA66683.1 hypothetical protein [Agrobacterium vitis]MVA87546.1 hypothetical protein [Agrobacterium vitis]